MKDGLGNVADVVYVSSVVVLEGILIPDPAAIFFKIYISVSV